MNMYMTFGCGQMLQGYQIMIIGDDEDHIRRAVYKNFGLCYSSLYTEPSKYEKLLCVIDLDNCDVPDEYYNSIMNKVKKDKDYED